MRSAAQRGLDPSAIREAFKAYVRGIQTHTRRNQWRKGVYGRVAQRQNPAMSEPLQYACDEHGWCDYKPCPKCQERNLIGCDAGLDALFEKYVAADTEARELERAWRESSTAFQAADHCSLMAWKEYKATKDRKAANAPHEPRGADDMKQPIMPPVER